MIAPRRVRRRATGDIMLVGQGGTQVVLKTTINLEEERGIQLNDADRSTSLNTSANPVTPRGPLILMSKIEVIDGFISSTACMNGGVIRKRLEDD